MKLLTKSILPVLLISVALIIWQSTKNSTMVSTREIKDRLEYALQMAGNNRVELEKVLLHYKNDSLKYKAAVFLVENMPGHYAYDSTLLCLYRPVIIKYDSLRELEQLGATFNSKDSANNIWEDFKSRHSFQDGNYSKPEPDVNNITSAFLIRDIDQAFKLWQNNPFKDSIDNLDFLKYVLPYRRQKGLVLEDWRGFCSNKSEFILYDTQFQSVKSAIDSLLVPYKDYSFDPNLLPGYPYIRLSDYIRSKKGTCEVRCWFNSMILNSLGFPVSIDYVPEWGNRNSKHSWNALMVNGKTYPFESFRGKEKWEMGKSYNNINSDSAWIKSRLPKVFRYSYMDTGRGPMCTRKINLNNIPPIFQDTKYEDVSEQYFRTMDITLTIRIPIPKETEFAYLCVFGNDRWKPVQWGKITNKTVMFEKMGRDIVYLPAFYREGKIIPINKAFILQQNGSMKFLDPMVNETEEVLLKRKYLSRPEINQWKLWNIGGTFQVSDNSRFDKSNNVFRVKSCESFPNIWKLSKPVTTRYARYVIPANEPCLAELYFYTSTGDILAKLDGNLLHPDKNNLESYGKAFDNDILSFVEINKSKAVNLKQPTNWVGLDFGKLVNVVAVGMCPRNDKNNVIKGLVYELFYWKDRWVSVGTKLANEYWITYDNVPKNTLLLLKCSGEGLENRIFTYEYGKQIWW